MSIEGELRSQSWHLPEGFDTAKALMFLAADEIDQLRAAAAERDELKAKANVSICAWCGQECEKSATGISEHVITCEKRPEHAILVEFEKVLATITAQDVRIAELEQDLRYMSSAPRLQDYAELEDAIVAQAAQLERAHNLVVRAGRVINNLKSPDSSYDLIDDMRAWLTDNAPEDKPEQTEMW